MKKSGGAQFSGIYIMYALATVALILLVIFIVRGSLIERFVDNNSQWKRTQQNNNIVMLTKTKGTQDTSDDITKFKINFGGTTYSLRNYLKNL